MSLSTIPSCPPLFPGDFGTFADQAPELGTCPRVVRVRKPNRRPGSVVLAAVLTLILSFLLGTALALTATAAHAAATGTCLPYSFTVSGNETCLPVNRENTVWRFASPGAQYDRDIAFIRYCGRIGAVQHRWGHEYRCTHLDDSGIWELVPAAVATLPVTRAEVTVHGNGMAWQEAAARFPVCVDRVEAYAEPVSGDYADFSWTHYPQVKAGHVVRLRLGFNRSDETGTWYVTSVVAWECGSGKVVQLGGYGAHFQVQR